MENMEVWIVEDCEFDMNESSVIDLFNSLEKAKACVLTLLKEKVMSMEDEIDDADEDDYEDLCDSYNSIIEELNETIETIENPECYSVGTHFKMGGYLVYSRKVQ